MPSYLSVLSLGLNYHETHPVNLAELLADAKKLKPKGKKKIVAKSAADTEEAYRRTKEELRNLALARCIPESIHLRVTHQTCNCGKTYEAVNLIPLVKCVSPSLTHYQPEESLKEFPGLPYFIEITQVSIPYCIACIAEAIPPVETLPNDDAETAPGLPN